MLKQLAIFALAISPALGMVDVTSTVTTRSDITTSTSAGSTSSTAPGRCGPRKCSDQCALDLVQCDQGSTAVLSHCSAFFQDVWVTIAPETTWVTSVVATDVVITTNAVGSAPVKRDLQKRVTVTTIASWAPDCHNDEQYSSACSCYGATQPTLTFTPDPITSTVSITATVKQPPVVS